MNEFSLTAQRPTASPGADGVALEHLISAMRRAPAVTGNGPQRVQPGSLGFLGGGEREEAALG